MISPENAIYTVLKAFADAAIQEDALNETDVQPTAYSPIRELRTIRVGNCESEFAPVGETIKEFDADIILQILAKVEDAEDAETYPLARDASRTMAMKTIEILNGNRTLNGQVCDLIVGRAFRGWARIEGGIYAAALVPVTVNPTNQ